MRDDGRRPSSRRPCVDRSAMTTLERGGLRAKVRRAGGVARGVLWIERGQRRRHGGRLFRQPIRRHPDVRIVLVMVAHRAGLVSVLASLGFGLGHRDEAHRGIDLLQLAGEHLLERQSDGEVQRTAAQRLELPRSRLEHMRIASRVDENQHLAASAGDGVDDGLLRGDRHGHLWRRLRAKAPRQSHDSQNPRKFPHGYVLLKASAKLRAASAGDAARENADTMASPSAAATMPRARSGVMPRWPRRGSPPASRGTAANPPAPFRRGVCLSLRRIVHGPDADVVREGARRRGDMRFAGDRKTDRHRRTHEAPHHLGGQVGLAQVHAIGAHGHREIDVVVHDERNAARAEHREQAQRPRVFAAVGGFGVAVLHERDAPGHRGLHVFEEVPTIARRIVRDEIDGVGLAGDHANVFPRARSAASSTASSASSRAIWYAPGRFAVS